MGEHYQQLVDGLEPRTENVRSAGETQRLQARVEHLPMADPHRATEQLGSIVALMLSQQWEGSERAKVLQLLTAPVQALAEGVDASIVAESHPLPTTKIELAAATLAMRQRLGQCWCLALHEICAPGGRIPMLGRRRVNVALNHAAAHLAAALILAYQLHRTPPAGLWQRLHAVYGFAAAHRLHRGSVSSPDDRRDGSLQDRYASSILLAMANPYGFQQRELLDLAALVRALAVDAEFHVDGEGTVLVASAGADSGPGYLPQDREPPSQGDLALDVGRVLETVEEQLQWTPPEVDVVSLREGRGGAGVLIHRDMLRRVIRSWQGMIDRGFQRMPAGHMLMTVLGLHAVHQVFAEGRSFESFQRQLSGDEIELVSGNTAASWVAGSVGRHAINPSRAQVLDQGLGGYRLSWSPEQRVRMKIGDMIALAPQGSETVADTVWLLGLIRWLRGDDDGGFEVGIELLARHAYAAGVRSIDRHGERSPMHRALLLADEAQDRGIELVVPHLFDRHVSELEWSTIGNPSQGQALVRDVRSTIASVDSLSTAYYRVSLAAP